MVNLGVLFDFRVQQMECLVYFCGGCRACLVLPKFSGLRQVFQHFQHLRSVCISHFICHKLATPCWNLSPTVGLVAIILVEAEASYPPPRDEPSGWCLIVPGTNIHQHTRPASLKVAYFGAGLLFCLNAEQREDLSEVFLWSCSICNSAAVLGTICIHQRCNLDGVMSTQCWEYSYGHRGTFVKFDSQHQDWFRVFL